MAFFKRHPVILFLLCATAALAVHYVVFAFRYMWYITTEDANTMLSIYVCCMAAIVLPWIVFPSRIAVTCIALVAMFFPHFIFPPGSRPLLANAFDSNAAVAGFLVVVMLVFATWLRRRLRVAIKAPDLARDPGLR